MVSSLALGLGLGVTSETTWGAGAVPTALDIAKRSFQEFVDPTISSTVTGSPVAIIQSPYTSNFTRQQNFQRSTLASPGDRPSISGGRMTFDGTNDVLDASAAYT